MQNKEDWKTEFENLLDFFQGDDIAVCSHHIIHAQTRAERIKWIQIYQENYKRFEDWLALLDKLYENGIANIESAAQFADFCGFFSINQVARGILVLMHINYHNDVDYLDKYYESDLKLLKRAITQEVIECKKIEGLDEEQLIEFITLGNFELKRMN